MTRFGRLALLWMIPLNLVLVPWIWFGRIVFGVGGWFFLILAPVALVVAIALAITTILAFTQAGRPRSLTAVQAVLQSLTWLALLVFGTFMPDFGDAPDSDLAFLTQVFGRSDALMDLSWSITLLAALAAVLAWLALLISLIAGRRDAAPA
ncbi:MAG: hypothetical protein F2667_10000 [Actinobacteria bacterium]|nr:hypothetical protein [Actinomycetota bacterium]